MESSIIDCKMDKSESQNWKRLSEWIHCICVVTFDLELGQAMEVCDMNLLKVQIIFCLHFMSCNNSNKNQTYRAFLFHQYPISRPFIHRMLNYQKKRN